MGKRRQLLIIGQATTTTCRATTTTSRAAATTRRATATTLLVINQRSERKMGYFSNIPQKRREFLRNKSMIIWIFQDFLHSKKLCLSLHVVAPSTFSVVISLSIKLKHHFFIEIIQISMGRSLNKFLFWVKWYDVCKK